MSAFRKINKVYLWFAQKGKKEVLSMDYSQNDT